MARDVTRITRPGKPESVSHIGVAAEAGGAG